MLNESDKLAKHECEGLDLELNKLLVESDNEWR
jgi:hypothetical protein